MKFRGLLNHFVGTHSFHNYASTKGRQLKEVRKRVQASIDLKKAGGAAATASAADSPEPEAAAAAADTDQENSAEISAEGGGSKKRERPSKENWRTYRYKKKSAVDRQEEDSWYGKSGAVSPERENAAEPRPVENRSSPATAEEAERDVETPTIPNEAVGSSASSGSGSVPAVARAVEVKGEGVIVEADSPAAVEGADKAGLEEEAEVAGKGEGDEGPEKVLLLRELRTRWAFFCWEVFSRVVLPLYGYYFIAVALW